MTSAIRYMTQHASLRKQKLGGAGAKFPISLFFFFSFFFSPAIAKIRQPGGNFFFERRRLWVLAFLIHRFGRSVERRLARAEHRAGAEAIICIHSTST